MSSAAMSPSRLAEARLRADPLADTTIERVLEGCAGPAEMWLRIGMVNQQLASWQTNADLDHWRATPDTPACVAEALEGYVRAARPLPAWADASRIGRAESAFMDMSMLSCTLLFCASLPECYVLPDLSAVLHVAGQLERHTDYRIRATAAMIFPVMMKGGLTSASGGGIAQIIKVRLIHATIRHLILRGTPCAALENGCAIRSNNPATLGFKIEKLLNDPDRMAKMRENALKFARPNAAQDISDWLKARPA